jgi:hypothetical protein
LVVGAQIIGTDAQPAAHVAASHVHRRGLRRLHQGVRLRRIDADHGAALAAGGDGHVAADEEGEPAEHLLLGQFRVAADELPDAPG